MYNCYAMKKLLFNLNFQVITGIVLGIIVGFLFPSFGANSMKLISQVFIRMITMLIGLIIFFTIVLGYYWDE